MTSAPLSEEELLFIQKECRKECEAYKTLEQSNNLSENDHRLWLNAIKEWNDIQEELRKLRETEKTAQEWVLVEPEKDDDWIVVDSDQQQ